MAISARKSRKDHILIRNNWLLRNCKRRCCLFYSLEANIGLSPTIQNYRTVARKPTPWWNAAVRILPPSYIAQEFGFLVMKHKQSLLRGSKGVLRFPGFCNMVGNLGWLVPRDEGSKDKRGLFLKAWLVPKLVLFQDVKGPYVWKVPRHMKGPQIWGVPKWEFSRFAGFPGIRIPRYVGSLGMSKGMEVSQVWEVNMRG